MFAKSGKGASAPARPPKVSGCFSVIGAEVVVTGDIVTTENLQVNGRIEGDVRCGALHQGPSGTIRGHIVAEQGRIAGLVDGTVTARLLILEPSARVTGDVIYETLSIESGARVEGRFAHKDAGAAKGQPPRLVLDDEDTAEAAE